ncbi:MAG: FtsW/RodA/SpoVE family cell cycle protein [Acidimicrobiales bacterium]
MSILLWRTPPAMRHPHGAKARRRTELGLLVLASLIAIAAYTLMVLGTTSKLPTNALPLFASLFLLAGIAHVANRVLAPNANAAILPIAFLLNGIGYTMIQRLDLAVTPHTHYAQAQALWTATGIAVYVITLFVIRRSRDLDRYRYLLLFGGVGLLLLPLVPHLGANINGARLWIRIGTHLFQPVEISKLMLCIFFAAYFAERRELLTIPTARFGNRLFLDPRPLLPITLAWACALGIMSFEHDIGFSGLLFTLFIGMLWVTTGRTGYLVFGVVLFAIGAYLSSRLFVQTNIRIETWLNPWKVIPPNDPGYQLRQAWYAMGSGGIGGTGLGLGAPQVIPNANTDFIFAAVGEEMGLLGSTAVVVAFLMIVGAGLRIAQAARTEFAKLLATGMTIIIGFQSFFIIGGVVRLLPLTGITLPFVSYGGSALIANYALIAVLMRVSDEGATTLDAAEKAAYEKVQEARKALLAGVNR